MIEWLKDWTNSIIVSVIIAIIFELIIPNGNNKKYIKMVISLYVLFVILNPIISKFTSLKGIEINTKEYEKYFNNENKIEASTSLNYNKIINNTAQKTIKDNIKGKLQKEGYIVTSISIDIDNKNERINNIKIVGAKKNTETENNGYTSESINISINTVENVNISDKNNKKDNLKKSDIQRIKKIISEEYEISEESIEVN